MLTVVLCYLLALPLIKGYALKPTKALRSTSTRLWEERPKLEFKDEQTIGFRVRGEPSREFYPKLIHIDVKEEPVTKKPTATPKPRAQSITFGSASLEDFKDVPIPVEPKPKQLVMKPEDINGIQPAKPFVFSIVAAGMAVVGWKLSNYLSAHFAVQYLTSDFYPVQRLAIVARNVVVGIVTLGTGFSGMIALGLFGLGVAVTIGVLRGELDPNKPRE